MCINAHFYHQWILLFIFYLFTCAAREAVWWQSSRSFVGHPVRLSGTIPLALAPSAKRCSAILPEWKKYMQLNTSNKLRYLRKLWQVNYYYYLLNFGDNTKTIVRNSLFENVQEICIAVSNQLYCSRYHKYTNFVWNWK